MRESFVLFTEHLDILDDLSDAQAGEVIKALMHAQRGEDVMPQDQAARIAFRAIRAQVDRCHELYDKRSAAGTKGASSRWGDGKAIANNSKDIANDSKPCQADGEEWNPDPVPVPDKKETSPNGDEKKKRFAPPSLDDVKSYIREGGYNVDAERFMDYYGSNGWKVGKNPMKDWKATVRNWNRTGVTMPRAQSPPAASGRGKDYYEEIVRRVQGC